MSILIKNAILNEKIVDIAIVGDTISKIGVISGEYDCTIDASNLNVLPAFVDIHTHLREPGFEYKEDIASGSMAAVAGGFASICCMPNTSPVLDSKYLIKYVIDRAKEVGLAKVFPIGAISVGLKGEIMSEMGKLKQAGIVAVSDDGQPVTTAQMMRMALEYSSDFDLLVMSHCEDKSLVDEGVVNEGFNATKLGLKGIPSAAEDVMISREIILAEMLDCRVHICHVSTKTGVQLIREAKQKGIKVSCETCPHYIAGTDDLIQGYNTLAKVNPPMREESDRLAIIKGLQDGTIDVIATDHAPHSQEEKSYDIMTAPFGISGLESAFALCYTNLVETKVMTLQNLSDKMTKCPAQLVGIPYGQIEVGAKADIVLVDLKNQYSIDSAKFFSKGKNTPFDGYKVKGKVMYTLVEGQIKFQNNN